MILIIGNERQDKECDFGCLGVVVVVSQTKNKKNSSGLSSDCNLVLRVEEIV